MPPVAFNPSEPFEEEVPAATFDPKQPFEEAGDAPSFDPNSPFQEESNTPAKPIKKKTFGESLSDDLSSNDPVRVAQAQQRIAGQVLGMTNTGLKAAELTQNQALTEDPTFAKRKPTTVREKFNAAMEPLNVPGRILNSALQDAAATLTGNPSQGGNLITMATESTPEKSAVLPYQKNLADISKSNPVTATVGKIAGGLVEGAPMIAVLPQGVVGKLIGAGFTADMISHIPEAGTALGEEMGKNPEDRDHDKITTALSTIASSAVMAGLGATHIGKDTIKVLAKKLKSAPVEAPTAPEPQIGLNGEFAKTHPTAEPLPEVESVPLDPQTGQPISNARSTLEKADARLAQIAAEKERTQNASAKPSTTGVPVRNEGEGVGGETPLRQPGEVASPQEAGKANAPLDKTSGSEGVKPAPVENLAQRYDRLKAKKAAGELTDPVEIAQFEEADKKQKALQGGFAEMKAQLEKVKAEREAAAKEAQKKDWQVTVQSPVELSPGQKMPGYIQIDDIAGGKNNWSKNPEALRQEGHDVPDFSKLPQGKYTYSEAVKLLKTANEMGAEFLGYAGKNKQLLKFHKINPDGSVGYGLHLPVDFTPEMLKAKIQELKDKEKPSVAPMTVTPPTVAPEQGANPPVVGEQPAAPVKRTKAEITKDREDFGILVGEQGEGFIPNFDLEQYEAARLKLGKDSVANVGLSNYFREVNKVILEKLGYDKNVRQTDALLAEALPKFRKYLEEQSKKEEGGVETDVSNTNVDESWNPEPPSVPPGDVGPGLGAAKVEEVAPAGTGLKNAIGDVERELHGLPEAYQKQVRNMPEVWQEAADIIAKDPQAGKKLADELKWNPQREMTDTDSALLLRHKVALENAKNQAAEDTITGKTPEARAEAQARFDDLSLQLTDLLDAARFRGSQWGREGRWRQALAFEDYSLETMVSDKQVELGRKLTPAEHAEVQKMQKRIAELEKQLADKKVKDVTGEKAGAVEESVDATVKKAKAQKARDKAAGVERDLAAEEKEALDYLKESFGENGDFRDTQNVIRKLMELLAESGVHERLPMEDAIHRFLQGIDPRITREQAQDLMSNYGKSRLPSSKPAKVIVRDINAQILSVRKLLDYFQGKRPKLTGQLRDVPSQIQRNLLKMVNEAKKNFKLEGPTDSAKSIKSALDAVNTRLKNRLADLKQEVVTRRKIIRERTPSPYNEETLRLKREIEEVQKQHDEIFGTEMTDAQRLALAEKSADRQIAELERQIKTGEIFPKSKEEFNLRSEKLDAAKARLEELKLERKFAREASQPRPEREVRQGEARIKALDKKIAEIERQIKNDEVFSKGRKVKDQATDPRIIAREEKLNALKAEREFARERLQPGLEPHEAFLLNYQQRLRRMASKYQERLARGDFEPKPKKTPPVDANTNRLSFELAQAKGAWHEAMMKDRLAKRSKFKKVLSAGQEVLNTSRAILTSLDLSAVLRQGGFIALGHPVRAAKAFPAMFKALRSKEGQHAVNEEIMARPNFPAYKRAKLYLSEHGKGLSNMEEAYMTRWAEKIPLVAASERAYVTFLNKLRADSFDAMAETLGRKGEFTEAEANAVANYINVSTGRGSLGAKEQALVGLNTVLFAPRYVASRFQMLAGQPLYRGSARTRLAIAKEYGRFLAGIGIIYGLAQLDGAEIESDPRSADFGKLRYGRTRVDPMAGLLQGTTLVSRLASGETKNTKGRIVPIRGDAVPYSGATSADVIGRFLRTKLNPIFGTSVDILSGKNLVGEKVTPQSVAQNMLVPLSMQDIYATMKEQGVPRGTALSLLSTFGMGLQTRQNESTK